MFVELNPLTDPDAPEENDNVLVLKAISRSLF